MQVIGGKLEGDWFCESDQLWEGRSMALKIRNVLYEAQTDFQHIRVFDSVGAGRVLTLDNIIQLSENDECAYQEMLTHVPLFAHPNPEKVLIIGGGDGGIVREVVRHSSVQAVDLCEIDPQVVAVARKFLPFTACSLDDPRVRVLHEDGARWVADHPQTYDVIIVDSSDPIGPAQVLFQEKFYTDMRNALRPGGCIGTQAECVWIHRDIIMSLIHTAKGLYDQVDYCWTSVPTYPSGTIGLLMASLGPDVKKPLRQPDAAMAAQLRYYTPRIHEAAFVLPAFVERWFAASE